MTTISRSSKAITLGQKKGTSRPNADGIGGAIYIYIYIVYKHDMTSKVLNHFNIKLDDRGFTLDSRS